MSYESKDKMNQSNTIREIPGAERPYEKCVSRGAASLSDAELLAVLLRTGTRGENAVGLAEKILYQNGGRGLLEIHHISMEKLMRIKGIGKVKAVQICCLSELAKRLARTDASKALDFASPGTIAEYYMEDLRHEKQEKLKLLMLNSKAKLVGESEMSKGTVNASLITPRELFIEALDREAVSIIILHNHPSGDPSPSRDDVLLTRRIREAGSIIGIELLDHIIIGNNCYISFREKELL